MFLAKPSSKAGCPILFAFFAKRVGKQEANPAETVKMREPTL
jgi:hypothetical protein